MYRTSRIILLVTIILLPLMVQAGKDDLIKVTSDPQGEELVQKWIETHKAGDSFEALDCVGGECVSYVRMTCYYGTIITILADTNNTSNLKNIYKEKCTVEDHYMEWVDSEGDREFSQSDYANDGKCTSGDCKNGVGNFSYLNNCKYMGGWKNGKRHGQGVMILPDDGRYCGDFVNAKYEGIGTYTNPDGEDYTGQWKESNFDGFGIHVKSSGESYTGRFRKHKRHGEGTCSYTNGDVYKGEWKNDKTDGPGTMYYSDGTRYEGQWKEGLQDGEGTLYRPDGSVDKKGKWQKGKFIGDKK